jgi:hypothetical protein
VPNISEICAKFYKPSDTVWFGDTAYSEILTPRKIEQRLTVGEMSLLGTNCTYGFGVVSRFPIPNATIYLKRKNDYVSVFGHKAQLEQNLKLAQVYSIIYNAKIFNPKKIIHFEEIVIKPQSKKPPLRYIQNKLLAFPRPLAHPFSQMNRTVVYFEKLLPKEPIENLQLLFFTLLSSLFGNQIGFEVDNAVMRGQLLTLLINQGQGTMKLASEILERFDWHRVLAAPDPNNNKGNYGAPPYTVIRSSFDKHEATADQIIEWRKLRETPAITLLGSSSELMRKWSTSIIQESLIIMGTGEPKKSKSKFNRKAIDEIVELLDSRHKRFRYMLAKMIMTKEAKKMFDVLFQERDIPRPFITNLIRCASLYSAYMNQREISSDCVWEVVKTAEVWLDNITKLEKISNIL